MLLERTSAAAVGAVAAASSGSFFGTVAAAAAKWFVYCCCAALIGCWLNVAAREKATRAAVNHERASEEKNLLHLVAPNTRQAARRQLPLDAGSGNLSIMQPIYLAQLTLLLLLPPLRVSVPVPMPVGWLPSGPKRKAICAQANLATVVMSPALVARGRRPVARPSVWK